MKSSNILKISIIFFISSLNLSFANTSINALSKSILTTTIDSLTAHKKSQRKRTFDTSPPVITATGDQLYCPGNSLRIVEDISISHDPSETGTQAVYVQISSGYSSGYDILELSNSTAHPTISTNWDATAGKLKLSGSNGATTVLYADFVSAIKDIVFSNASSTASGTRTFSITIGQANYLPSTGHFYLFVPSTGITWSAAKTAAQTSTYYGLQGYLATILSTDEAKLIGEQASGTGWIGGSDAETEGIWKWVTGPETGTVFYNQTPPGSTPNFAFWNTNEPNNLNEEDYAHITQPGIGVRGSWNDLSNTGSLISGDAYQPKGYVVEYGGLPGEAPLQIAASTKITIAVANPQNNSTVLCDSGTLTLNATATSGTTLNWYDSAVGGTLLGTGNSFTTPVINSTTTYYVDAGCESNRKAIVATVNSTPTTPVATQTTYSNCGPGSITIEASTNVGLINWFASATGGSSLHTGNSFSTPVLQTNTTYYAQATNNGCVNTTRSAINILIYSKPVVTDQTLILCQDQKVKLNAGLPGMTYNWSTGQTSQIIITGTPGTYTVDITSPAPESCTSRKTIVVEEHLIPEFRRIEVDGTQVTLYLTQEADYYQYSIDGLNFQDSKVFYNVPGGLKTAYVQEKNGCGSSSLNFVVLVFPPFFTPNNDSFNDLWEVNGLENYPQAQLTIFDRYGKLLTELSGSKMGWDGTINQTALPSSDYWYALKIDNTQPILRGHFTLKR